MTAPRHCGECGAAFPWLQARLEAAGELADEMEHLTKEDKARFRAALPHVVADTPKTPVAAARIRGLLQKAGAEATEGAKKILLDVLTEAARRLIFPP